MARGRLSIRLHIVLRTEYTIRRLLGTVRVTMLLLFVCRPGN